MQAYSYSHGRSTAFNKSDHAFTVIVAILVLLFSTLSILYLSHENAAATSGYKIKTLQEQQMKLQDELDIWNLKITRLQSMSTLSEAEMVQNMGGFADFPKFVRTTKLASATLRE